MSEPLTDAEFATVEAMHGRSDDRPDVLVTRLVAEVRRLRAELADCDKHVREIEKERIK